MSLVLADSRRLRFTAFTAFYFAQGVPIGLLQIALVGVAGGTGRGRWPKRVRSSASWGSLGR